MRVQVDLVRAAAVCLAVALCVSVTGCKKQGDTSSPSSNEKAGEAPPLDDASDPVAELAALEGRMRALGLPVATDERAQTEESEDGVGATEPGGGAGEAHGKLAEEKPAPAPTTAQIDASPPERDESANYCGDLCSLSESICTLEVRICSLAESHANDRIYADACERAVDDCEVAGEACDSCG
jgi:hypothetical protein